MASYHLSGAAADIVDATGEIKRWILDNLEYIEAVGLWFEDFSQTKSWVHAQIFPPKSGKRFFIA